jgi:hypothetical protein
VSWCEYLESELADFEQFTDLSRQGLWSHLKFERFAFLIDAPYLRALFSSNPMLRELSLPAWLPGQQKYYTQLTRFVHIKHSV